MTGNDQDYLRKIPRVVVQKSPVYTLPPPVYTLPSPVYTLPSPVYTLPRKDPLLPSQVSAHFVYIILVYRIAARTWNLS